MKSIELLQLKIFSPANCHTGSIHGQGLKNGTCGLPRLLLGVNVRVQYFTRGVAMGSPPVLRSLRKPARAHG